MPKLMLLLGALIAGAFAVCALLLGAYGWVLTPETFPRRLWQRYAAWQQELASYLLDPTTPTQFARRHALMAVGGLVAGVALWLVAADTPIVAVAGLAVGLGAPFFLYPQRVQTRRELLQQQVDPALQFIANALQVAPNLDESLNLVALHLRPPMSEEVARVSAAYRLGQSLDDALQGMAERCNDPFVTSMVIALVVGRRTGGNISATLRRIAHSTREAVRVELELNTKTKGQRNQFYLVALLYPFGLVGLKQGMPTAWQALTDTYMGKVALCASLAVVLVSVVWAQKILSPKNL